MPKRTRLTKAFIDALAAPPTGRMVVYDSAAPGLALRITAADARSWVVYRRLPKHLGGDVIRETLGAFPAMPIEAARAEAARLNGQIANGIDPRAKRLAARGEMTLSGLWDIYLAKHAKVHKRERSVEEDERNWKLHLSAMKARQLSAIKRSDVQSWHAKIGDGSGPYAANRALALLSKLFNFAAFDCDIPVVNPARGVKKFKEQTRQRFLQADELRAFFESLKAEPNETIRDWALLAVFTGARRRNVQSMRWADVNIERATWTIPADQSKGGEAMTIHLPAPALEVLAKRKDNGSPWVLPGRGSASGHLEEVKTGWSRIIKRAGIADLRPHDLRRTLGSWQAATGASLPIIGRSLGHRTPQATAIYARLDLSPIAAAVNMATDAMLLAGGVTTPAKPGKKKTASKNRKAVKR